MSTLPMNPDINPAPSTVGTTNETARVDWVQTALAALPAGWRLLDAGAGEQQFRKFCPHLRYVSQDFAQYVPQNNPSGLQMPAWNYGTLDIVSDIAAIPQPDASFDAILCTEVFEHIPDPVQAMREFSRLLRPGGMLILTAPFCSLTHFAPHHHATGFSRYYYEAHLPPLGFEIIEITPNGNWFEYIAQEIRRISQVSRRYAGLAPSDESKAAMRQVLDFLQEASASGATASELLCFGYHVRARRLARPARSV